MFSSFYSKDDYEKGTFDAYTQSFAHASIKYKSCFFTYNDYFFFRWNWSFLKDFFVVMISFLFKHNKGDKLQIINKT